MNEFLTVGNIVLINEHLCIISEMGFVKISTGEIIAGHGAFDEDGKLKPHKNFTYQINTIYKPVWERNKAKGVDGWLT